MMSLSLQNNTNDDVKMEKVVTLLLETAENKLCCVTLKEHECQQKEEDFVTPLLLAFPNGQADVYIVI